MALHKQAVLVLLGTCVVACTADAVVSLQTQGGMTRGTVVQRVYALDGSGNSHLMGVIQRFGPDEQGATGADLFRQGSQSPFDSFMLGQSLRAPNPLEEIVGTLLQLSQSMIRPPCPYMQQAQLNGPGALSYMARNRFGPALMTSLAQFGSFANQIDNRMELAEDDSDDTSEMPLDDEEAEPVVGEEQDEEEEEEEEDDSSDSEAETDFFSAALLAPEDAQWAAEEPSGERWRALGASWLPASQAQEGNEEDRRTALFFAPKHDRFLSFDEFGQPVMDRPPRWALRTEEGSTNWDFLVFLVLCACSGGLAFVLVRTCCHSRRQAGGQCGRGQFMTRICRSHSCKGELAAPLLEPLEPEAAILTPAPRPLFANVEVASEHAPKGPEYVTIAYVPLKSEEQH